MAHACRNGTAVVRSSKLSRSKRRAPLVLEFVASSRGGTTRDSGSDSGFSNVFCGAELGGAAEGDIGTGVTVLGAEAEGVPKLRTTDPGAPGVEYVVEGTAGVE